MARESGLLFTIGFSPSVRGNPASDPDMDVKVSRVTVYVLVGLLLGVLIFGQVVDVYSRDREGGDFVGTIWQPAWNILHAASPYPDASTTDFVSESVYPPAIFVVSLPLAFLPADVATVLWQFLLVGLAVMTLLVLGVRDWRCHVLWLFSCSVVLDVLYGNAMLAVVFCCALLWRWRNSPNLAAIALALGVAIKLVLAPLWLWLIATRRYRAALLTAMGASVLIFVPWLVIGLDGLTAYPDRLQRLSDSLSANGVLVHAFARQLGLGEDVTFAVSVSIAALLFLLALALRRDELSSFTLFIAGALALTPIAWIYYPALLIVPVAVRWPRLAWPWIAFGALWVSWVYTPLGWATARLSAVVIVICAAIVAATVLTVRREHDAAPVRRDLLLGRSSL